MWQRIVAKSGIYVTKHSCASASRLLIGLKKLVHIRDNQRVRVTTDKLAAYRHALTKHFPAQSYVYLQIVKNVGTVVW